MLRTLPDAHRISAWPNSAPLTATRTNDIVEMQPQRPRPLAARRAYEPRPRAAVRKLPQTDADVLLDVAELNKERRRLSRDDVHRPQARDRNGWQIIAVFRYPTHIKLDTSETAQAQPACPGARLVASFGAGCSPRAVAAPKRQDRRPDLSQNFCFPKQHRVGVRARRTIFALWGTINRRISSSILTAVCLGLGRWGYDGDDIISSKS